MGAGTVNASVGVRGAKKQVSWRAGRHTRESWPHRCPAVVRALLLFLGGCEGKQVGAGWATPSAQGRPGQDAGARHPSACRVTGGARSTLRC